MLDLVAKNIWLSVLYIGMASCAFSVMLLISARAYARGAANHITYERGAAQVPAFLFSGEFKPRHAVGLALKYTLSFSLLTLAWWWFFRVTKAHELAVFALGMLFLYLVSLIVNWAMIAMHFAGMANPKAVTGSIMYSAWLLLRHAAAHCLGFAVIWGELYALTGEIFFLGGSLMCACFAFTFGMRSRKLLRVSTQFTQQHNVGASERGG